MFVSTSTSPRVARLFAAREAQNSGEGWVYAIREQPQRGVYDVNALFGSDALMSEREMAVPYEVKLGDILGARKIDTATGKFVPESYVRNPYFEGDGGGGGGIGPATEFWLKDRPALIERGLSQNGMALYEGADGPEVFKDNSGDFTRTVSDNGIATYKYQYGEGYQYGKGATGVTSYHAGAIRTGGRIDATNAAARAEGITGTSETLSLFKRVYADGGSIDRFDVLYEPPRTPGESVNYERAGVRHVKRGF